MRPLSIPKIHDVRKIGNENQTLKLEQEVIDVENRKSYRQGTSENVFGSNFVSKPPSRAMLFDLELFAATRHGASPN